MSIQAQAMDAFQSFHSTVSGNSQFEKLEAQTGIPKAYLAMGGIGVYLLLTFLNFGGIGQLLSNLTAVVIPGYHSLVALETVGTGDDTQWLTYWVVYAAFNVLEFWSSLIVYYVPFYWVIKALFFLYLGTPQFSGAKLVYEKVIKPLSQDVLQIKSDVASNLKEKPE